MLCFQTLRVSVDDEKLMEAKDIITSFQTLRVSVDEKKEKKLKKYYLRFQTLRVSVDVKENAPYGSGVTKFPDTTCIG